MSTTRRWIAAGLASTGAAALLAGAATAFAGTSEYEGKIRGDSKTSVTMKVKRRDGERTVKYFEATKLRIECKGDVAARLGSASLDGAADVNRKGRFLLAGSSETQSLRIEGELEGRRRAHGTLRYRGMTEFEDGARKCRTGELKWVARR